MIVQRHPRGPLCHQSPAALITQLPIVGAMISDVTVPRMEIDICTGNPDNAILCVTDPCRHNNATADRRRYAIATCYRYLHLLLGIGTLCNRYHPPFLERRRFTDFPPAYPLSPRRRCIPPAVPLLPSQYLPCPCDVKAPTPVTPSRRYPPPRDTPLVLVTSKPAPCDPLPAVSPHHHGISSP